MLRPPVRSRTLPRPARRPAVPARGGESPPRALVDAAAAAEGALLRTLMDHVPDFLYIKDRDSRFIRASRAVTTFLGLDDPAEAVGKTDFDFFPEELARRYFADEQQVVASGEAIISKLEPQDAEGTAWFLTSTVPVVDGQGRVVSLVGISRDITERQRIEAALRAGEARQRALFEAIPDLMFRFDRDGTYLDYKADRSVDLLMPPEQFLGRTVAETLPSEVAEPVMAALGRVLDHGGVEVVEYELVIDGEAKAFEARLAACGGDEVLAIVRNVTDRVRAEAALRASEERFRAFVETTDEWIWEVDVAGRNTYSNPAVEQILGYRPEELVGADILAFIHEEDRRPVEAMLPERIAAKQGWTGVILRWRHRDGTYRLLESSSVPILDAQGELVGFRGSDRDITARMEAEAARREAEARYRLLLEQLPAVVYTDAPDDVCTPLYVSPQAEHILGLSPEAWLAARDDWFENVHPGDRERVRAATAASATDPGSWDETYRYLRPDGTVVWVHDQAHLLRDAQGRLLYWQGIMRDVTAQKEAEAALRESETRYRTLVEQIPAVVYVDARGEGGGTVFVSPQLEALLGYRPEEYLADPELWERLLHPEDRARVEAEVARTTATGEPFQAEYRLRSRDGSWVWLRDEAVRLPGTNGAAQHWQGILLDVSAQKAAEAQLAHQAFHDPLTDLPNRALFRDRLEHALARTARRPETVAVLFIDLDDFKVVNDSLGHWAGDELLVAVGRRLRACVRDGDTLARVGGDEFTLLLEDVDAADAKLVAERVAEELRAPFDLDGHRVYVTPSLGIAVAAAGDRAGDLLRRADVALYEAKQKGKARFALFEVGMDARVLARVRLEADLRHAIEAEELVLHYQPLVDLASGRVAEVEALVRWAHPTGGLISPSEFIPLAEETGLIVPLGRWVLEAACRQVVAWQVEGACSPDLALSVNLSARQLRSPDLVPDVERALATSGLEPARLQLEVTESTAMDDSPETVAALRGLKDLGVRLAVDDFGTGYSALSYLRRCPVDALKVDRSYVAGLGHDPGDEAIVRAVLAFARTLGLGVTAEGVETAEQLDRLRALGCDIGQGYYFARPQPPEEIGELLRAAAESLRADVAVAGGVLGG